MFPNKTTTNNKSVFANNLNANNHYYVSQAQKNIKIIDIYHQLAVSIEVIQELLIQFALGNFQYVATHLNMAGYNTLAVLMNSLKHNSALFPDYEKIRTTINYSLEGLLQTVNQYVLLVNIQTQLEQTQKRANILNDMKLLKEYLDSLKGARTLFPATTVTSIAAEIKPEYSLYIKLYGYPANGIFDIDKLAECIRTVAP